MGELINTFHLDWKLMIAQIINFCIVFFVLYKFAIKPLSKNMDQRNSEINKSVANAKSIEEKLLRVESEKEQKILVAKKEAQKIIEQAREQGEAQGQQSVEDAKKEVEKVIADAKDQINALKEKTSKEIKAEASELVATALTKILKENLDKKIDQKIIEESLKEIK